MELQRTFFKKLSSVPSCSHYLVFDFSCDISSVADTDKIYNPYQQIYAKVMQQFMSLSSHITAFKQPPSSLAFSTSFDGGFRKNCICQKNIERKEGLFDMTRYIPKS